MGYYLGYRRRCQILEAGVIEGQKFARRCDCCGAGMNAGYVLVDEHACSTPCATDLALNRGYSSYQAMHDDHMVENDEEEMETGDVYWTQWEDDFQCVVRGGVLVEIEED